MSQFQPALPADTMTNRVLGRWIERNAQRSLAHAAATMEPADLITKDGPPREASTKIFKGGKQLGCVIWANTRTKQYAQMEIDPRGEVGRMVTGRVVTGFYDNLVYQDAGISIED